MKRFQVTYNHANQLISREMSRTKYAAADNFLSAVYWMIHGESLLDRQIGHNVMDGAKKLADQIRRDGLHECNVKLGSGKVSLTLA